MNKAKFLSPKSMSYIFLVFLLSLTYLPTSDAQVTVYVNKVASMSVDGIGYDITIKDNYAYITGNDGFIVVDIETPHKPKQVGEFAYGYGAFGIFVCDNIAFLAAGGYGLVIANISNPEDPTLIGSCSSDGTSTGVFSSNTHAFVSNFENGLQIFDITDLFNPIKIGEYTAYGRADNVIVVDDIAYVAFTNYGLVVLNVTDPSLPTYIQTVSYTGGAKGLAIHQNLLFVGCYSSSVLVLDISFPESPVILGVHTDSDEGEAQGVAGNSTHLYVADNFGVEYLDISDLPTISKKAENRERISSAHEVDFVGNYIFIAGGGVGKACLVFEVSDKQKNSFLGIYIGLPIAIVAITSFFIVYKLKIKAKKD